MKKNNDIKKELEEFSPLLAKIKAREPEHEVPENYFEALPDQVWEQIKLMPQPERAPVQPSWWERVQASLQQLMQPRIAAGLATFVVLIVAGIYFLRPAATSDDPFAQLTAEEVTAYMTQNADEFEPQLLMEAMGEQSDMSILSGSEFNEEEIEQLLDEVIEEMDNQSLEDLL